MASVRRSGDDIANFFGKIRAGQDKRKSMTSVCLPHIVFFPLTHGLAFVLKRDAFRQKEITRHLLANSVIPLNTRRQRGLCFVGNIMFGVISSLRIVSNNSRHGMRFYCNKHPHDIDLSEVLILRSQNPSSYFPFADAFPGIRKFIERGPQSQSQ